MREYRSGSQILFGHLPEQTIDAAGGIWKVRRWNDPKLENSVDVTALRDELIRAAYAWSEAGEDGGFVADLYANRAVRVKSLNRDDGVWCEPFPRLYVCNRCKRLHDEPIGRCQCGSTRRRGQLPLVGYHDACGAIKTPYVKKCPQHSQRAVRFPGTASAAELLFFCPICDVIIQRGFGASCDCDQGGTLSFTVHRSGTVYKSRGIVLINPPRREILRQVDDAGGGERALEWLLSGMPGRRLTDASASRGTESIARMLRDRGFDEATVQAMIAAMPQDPGGEPQPGLVMQPIVRDAAEQQAKQVALATFESRMTISELGEVANQATLRELYQVRYPRALSNAGLERVELIDRFPVLTGQFGYTRGNPTPGSSRLRTYREPNGDYTVYGELAQTEALFFRLDPLRVHAWLASQGIQLRSARDRKTAAEIILASQNGLPGDRCSDLLTTLVHSYSHALIRRAAVYAGIERSALSELVLPNMLSFFVYAAARGDFVLGGLQALFESELDVLLTGLVDDEHRCALDPGCSEGGSACAVCLHLGEPSCRMFNTALSRATLAGGTGYFDITTGVA